MNEESNDEWFSPYDSNRRIGSVITVAPTEIRVNLTNAGSGSAHYVGGQRVGAGEINEYVFIEVGATSILGKLTRVWLEGAERLSVDQINEKHETNHPIGLIQPFVSVNCSTGEVQRGIAHYPRLAAQVYAAHPALIQKVMEGKEDGTKLHFRLGHLPNDPGTKIHATPESLFTRHCAILGATGSGKSNTVAKLLDLIQSNGGKALLIDATGEYKNLPNCKTYYVGEHPLATNENRLTFPHYLFTETDLRALLRPSAQAQSAKLEFAIRSLKMLNWCYWQKKNSSANHGIKVEENGQPVLTFEKSSNSKAAHDQVWAVHGQSIESSPWSFYALAEQIKKECVWPDAKGAGGYTAPPDTTKWGGHNDTDLGHCLNLISRIKMLAVNPNMKWMIDPNPALCTIPNALATFCKEGEGILRFDLSHVPFEANAREILVNAIGRKLLSLARDKVITSKNPLLVFIDEAHQFINKAVGDEANRFALDAFGNLAKEGRKYGLNVGIATQRPRDILEEVLSQIGTFVVHRLTNPYDQELVKKAVGELDQSTAAILPTLNTGEALLLGVDFNFAMRVKIERPHAKPESESVEYSKVWTKASS